MIDLPAALRGYAARGPEWADWIDRLPKLVDGLLDDWELRVDGDLMHGYAALVVPVLTADGDGRVVKVSWPHDEQEHEHLGLQAWKGNGVVRLYRADPARAAMLLERLHPRDLTTVDVIEACEITARFYRRIHIPTLPQLRTLSSYIERWTGDLEKIPVNAPIPRRLVEQSIALGKDFVTDSRTNGAMIHGDLHFFNVLAADREPWIVIDPKPVSGDGHYEVAPLLWNRWDEAIATGDVREAVRARFFAVVDTAGLDEARARDWVVVRMIHNAMWAVEDDPDGTDPETPDYITMCIAIAKAVQD